MDQGNPISWIEAVADHGRRGANCPEARWFVAHTKPRHEKKLAQDCGLQGLTSVLPCYDSAHKYRGKTEIFRKPLFPGYVFLFIEPQHKDFFRRNDHVANVLDVFDQDTFCRQLKDILLAIDTTPGVFLAPSIGVGMRVRVKAGPLRGVEGWVEQRYGLATVLLRLDFISQAAAVQLEADLLEIV